MMNFTFPKKVKTMTFVLMAIGVIGMLIGLFGEEHVHGAMDRFWANIMVNGFMFFALALAALFFYALQHTAEVGWSAQIVRVLESIFSYLPIGALVLIIVFAVGSLGGHHIYEWMDAEEVAKDPILMGKSAYLNLPFFWIRTLIYLGIFLYFAFKFRKMSLEEDKLGGISIHQKLFKKSSVFLVFFAVFTTTFAWDWLMSIDVHWYSTLYGWQVFSGYWNMAMVFTTLLVLWLKSKGYLPHVNDSHIHDMGKWVFATGLLWVYLWFSQFMLIWYANIPEEVTYYMPRMYGEYRGLYFTMVLVNFILPFFVLMSRDAKRNPVILTIVGVLLFLFHSLDFYFLIIPGVVHDAWHGIKFYEVLIYLGFFGLLVFWVLNTLTKAPMIPANHPFLDESEHHHI